MISDGSALISGAREGGCTGALINSGWEESGG